MLRAFSAGLICALAAGGCGAPQRPVDEEVGPARPAAVGLDEEVARLVSRPSLDGEVPSGFRFSPDGSTLAYVRLDWQESTATGQLVALDVATRAERVLWPPPAPSIDAFEWFPDGRRLLVTSLGRLYVFELEASSGPRQLSPDPAEGARLSPDGTRVAFVRDHDLWVLDVDTGQSRRLTSDGAEARLNGEIDWVYQEELELYDGFWWSPDGRQLAFLQFDETPVTAYPVMLPGPGLPEVVRQRFPQAGEANPVVRLGVVGVAGEAPPAWPDLGTPAGEEVYVARVGWAPAAAGAAARIYVVTLDRLQRSLRVALVDPAGREPTRALLEEHDDQWLNLLGEPRFLASGDRFLWRSERDGFAHLYLHDLGGGLPRQLTRGEWVVTEIVDVDEAAGRVAFIANRENPTAYQLFTVPLEGGAEPTQVSRARGCHEVVASPDHRHYVDVNSSLDRPRRAELLDANGEPLAVVAPGDLGATPDLDDTMVRLFTVPGPDGVEYQAELFQPAQLEPGRRYPVLLAVYGGPAAQDVVDQWYTREASLWRLVARRGVLVFSIDGRGTTGRGHDWERPVYGRLTEVELEDQLRGVEFLRSLPYVDGDRIGVFGWSFGGTMTLAALLRHPGTFRVGVAVAPVTDWRFYDTIYTERYMMRPQDNPDGYQRTALWPLAGELHDPLLLVHGLSDDNVHFRNSERMIQALIEEERRFDLMVYPGQSHGIAAPPSRRHVYATIVAYLLEHLLAP